MIDHAWIEAGARHAATRAARVEGGTATRAARVEGGTAHAATRAARVEGGTAHAATRATTRAALLTGCVACLAVFVPATASCSKEANVPPASTVPISEPLFEGTGSWSRAVSKNADAQRYFDQGLRLLYGFNHDEALRSLAQALLFEPQCTMCFLVEALANGPHINNPDVDAAHNTAALVAVANASKLASTPLEHALVDALTARHADGPRPAADAAYAAAMATIWRDHPDDADVGAWYAEALVDTRPWDQWTHDGKMEPGTQAAVDAIDAVLKIVPQHPLANHLAVHIWEASPTPERAEVNADRLRTMAPALAHLVHMSTHLDVRRGRFAEAIVTSRAAIAADRKYLDDAAKRGVKLGFHRFYVAHDEHMLAYAAMMTGQRALALDAINGMVKDIPEEWLAENGSVADGIVALPLEVEMRFGMWDEILAAPEPAATLPIARALFHASRAVALAAKGSNIASARAELVAFDATLVAVTKDARFGNNDARAVLDVARALAAGEIDVADGHVDAGVRSLRAAITAEDALAYDEPPDWMQPARHALGAVLLNAGHAKEAEAVYDADLARVPGNGWALLGKAQALEAQGPTRASEAKAVRARFDRVWSGSDTTASTSCLCQQRHAR